MRLTQRESDLQGRRANLEKQLESADLEISTLKVTKRQLIPIWSKD